MDKLVGFGVQNYQQTLRVWQKTPLMDKTEELVAAPRIRRRVLTRLLAASIVFWKDYSYMTFYDIL